MAEACKKQGLDLAIPEMALCTDNGAMIAGVAQMKFSAEMLKRLPNSFAFSLLMGQWPFSQSDTANLSVPSRPSST